MADLKTSKITRLKIGYTNNESYLSESDSTALDILGDARITGNTNLYGNLNIIKNNINLFQVNQDSSITIPTLNVSNLSTTTLNINGSSFTDIQNNINSSISSSSSTAETNAKKFASSEIAKLNKSHTDGKYISSISAPNGNGNSAAITVNETSFDNYTSLTSLNGIQNKVITNYVDTKISNEKTARENKDNELSNYISAITNKNSTGSIANKIQNLEQINLRKIYSNTILSSNPWNSGKWLILGARQTRIYYADTYITVYGSFIFSDVTNPTVINNDWRSRTEYDTSWTPGHGGSASTTTVWFYYSSYQSSIKINNRNVTLSSTREGSSTYSWPNSAPKISFVDSDDYVIAIRIPDNISLTTL